MYVFIYVHSRSIMRLVLLLACLLTLVASQQIVPGVVIDDPSVSISTNYVCIYKPTSGTATLNFVGGSWANQPGTGFPLTKAVVFSGGLGTKTGTIIPNMQATMSYATTGLYWNYIRDLSNSNNIDYVLVEVVNFGSADCSAIGTSPPASYASNGNPP